MASIRERSRGVWEVTVSTGQIDPRTGRYGKISRTVRGGKRDAQTAANRLSVEVKEGRHKGERRTLVQLLDKYLEHQAVDKAPKTVLEARRRTEQIKADPVGGIDIRRLTALDLDEFYLRLAKPPRLLSETSRHHYHSLIKAALNVAIKWQMIPGPNPANFARAPSLSPEEREPPEPEQVRQLAQVVIEEHPDLAALIHWQASTGMRRGEVCGLRFRDIDLERGEVTVNQRISDLPGGPVVLPATKNKKRRRFAIDPFTVAVIAEQRDRAAERCRSVGVEMTADCYVWSQDADHTTPWRPDRVTDTFRRLRDREELPNVRLNDLRHFTATQLLGAGVDPRTVAGRLGHNTSVLLSIYGHRVRANDQAAAAAMADIMAKGDISG